MDPATVHTRVSVTCSKQERYTAKTPQVRLRFMFHYYKHPRRFDPRADLPGQEPEKARPTAAWRSAQKGEKVQFSAVGGKGVTL
jgi:hypothetical protein